MTTLLRRPIPFAVFALFAASTALGAEEHLAGTKPIGGTHDFSAEMVAEMSGFLDGELAKSAGRRAERWQPNFSSKAAYEQSVESNRARFARIIGVVDARVPDSEPEFVGTVSRSSWRGETSRFTIHAVRWPVLSGVYGEGLLLQPKGEPIARVVALPDADTTPEAIAGLAGELESKAQYARRLAESGCQVIVPVLLSRDSIFSGISDTTARTNEPHREWIYRQAYTFGRHVIGYEVQKVLAAVDWFQRQNTKAAAPIAVVGWGEGGLVAFYSAAVDRRIDATIVSGYFNQREKLWAEPIYRNIFSLLREFGDAEVSALVLPRALIVEHSKFPEVSGPPAPRTSPGRMGSAAAPGSIRTPSVENVRAEVDRAKQLAGPFASTLHFVVGDAGVSEGGLARLLQSLRSGKALSQVADSPLKLSEFDPIPRQRRQIEELERFTQNFIERSREVREREFWAKHPPGEASAWSAAIQPARDRLWDEVIGRLPAVSTPLNPQSRRIGDTAAWTKYEVTLDVRPEQKVWGYLLLPKDLKPGERRPVIVASHGGGGVPEDVVNRENRTYKGFAAQLADRGYIVFAPHFPWRAGDKYRELQRKANPLGLSVFSFILAHHESILDWLTTQTWADSQRIGLYGLSWGGKVAVRVPALLPRYALAIPSGDFNEWIWKNASTRFVNSYMFVPEYEMFDFNLGMTFGYAEMAAMIAPRPFMVERGHRDGVGIDEWVAFEYAKVNRLYSMLNVPHMTRIEFFRGIHEINGVGTFDFIERHFGLPTAKVAERR